MGDISAEDVATLDVVQFTTDHRVLVAADVIVIAVPTPLRDGGPDLSLVRSAAEDIARILRPGQLVVLESTTYPGTTEDLVRPILEKGAARSSMRCARAPRGSGSVGLCWRSGGST